MAKHAPANREEFKQKCLRTLGHPVLSINVTDDQIEDCIEEALKYYADYHFDGTEHVYYFHPVTEEDKINKYITLPDTITGIVEVVNSGTLSFDLHSSNVFSEGYQLGQQLTYELANGMMNGAVSNFYIMKSNVALLQQLLVGPTQVRYSRHTDRLHVDIPWHTVSEGSFIVVECYKAIDPEENPQVWNDRWLQKYATAKIKYIWGSNMSKFEGVMLPGGVTLNGLKTQDDAKDEIMQLEDEMLTNYSLPPRDMMY